MRAYYAKGLPEKGERRLAIFLLVGVALCWAVLDQGVKHWAETTLTLRDPVPVVGETLQWYLVYNSGAAFSILSDKTWVFTVLAAVVIGVILWHIPKINSLRWAAAIGLMLGGTLGNLYDRLFRAPGFAVGHVVDMISTPWLVPAVYNVADIGLVGAVIVMIILTLLNVRAERKKPKEGRSAAAETVRDA
ncbi:signal peptidase II [Canibacter sp. lx-72]|uniref:signal peptidase II n=1 Tax=Canibacter zhuwentaonis TaxID=2837491 RepID=UPI001BDD544E|nr:signal peptidase II [Canibacter zhuwentaonis]MBT1018254.1 signal peptidase II [Canibacter zhuwentaonis]MBT1035264.1 signal peptidase II [Canibacter zhuwentaonis]